MPENHPAHESAPLPRDASADEVEAKALAQAERAPKYPPASTLEERLARIEAAIVKVASYPGAAHFLQDVKDILQVS